MASTSQEDNKGEIQNQAKMSSTSEQENMGEMELAEKFLRIGKELSYSGQALSDYIDRKVKDVMDRRERAEARQHQQQEAQRQQEEAQRQHEIKQRAQEAVEKEKQRAEKEKQRQHEAAEKEKERAEKEKERAEKEKERAEKEKEEERKEKERAEKEKEEERKEKERAEKEKERAEKEKERQHEILMAQESTRQLQIKSDPSMGGAGKARVRYPPLPNFDESRDNMDTYIMRFEQHAALVGWAKDVWSTCLAAFLSGQALELYKSLTDTEGKVDYDRFKTALLNQFACTAEDARTRFRRLRPDQTKTGEAIGNEFKRALQNWLDRAEVTTFEGFQDLILREQLLDSVSKDLTIFILENKAKTFQEMVTLVDTFKMAHPSKSVARKQEGTATANAAVQGQQRPRQQQWEGKMRSERGDSRYNPYRKSDQQQQGSGSGEQAKKDRKGNLFPEGKHCFVCLNREHTARRCPHVKNKKALARCMGRARKATPGSGSDSASDADSEASSAMVLSSMSDHIGHLNLESGVVNGVKCSLLRDTGANVCGIRKSLVNKEQYTGSTVKCRSFGGRIEKFQVADVLVDSLYLKGIVRCCVLEDPVADLIIGNVPGMREEGHKHDEQRARAAVALTRARAKHVVVKKPLEACKESLDITKEELSKLQKADPSLKECFDKANTGETASVGGISGRYHTEDDILMRTFTVNNRTVEQVCVPTELRATVLKAAHDLILSGHCGARKTLSRLRQRFHWPGVTIDVAKYVASCGKCQKATQKGRVPPVPLADVAKIGTPMERVAIDLVGPIQPATEAGHKHILTILDIATRYPEAVPMKSTTSIDVAEALLETFARLGFPKEILSDKGTQFTSDLMEQFQKLCGCKGISTTPYHPQANGNVERFHSTLKQMLRKVVQDQPRQWHRFLPALLFAVREVPSESTGYSPFELMLGREVRGPIQLLCDVWTGDQHTSDSLKPVYNYVFELKARIRDTCQQAMESSSKQSAKNKKLFDRRSRERRFKVGEEVLILLPSCSNKLLSEWQGPFKVTGVRHPDYTISIRGREKTFHANMLKLFVQRQGMNAACGHAVCAGEPTTHTNKPREGEAVAWTEITTFEPNCSNNRTASTETQEQDVTAHIGVITDDPEEPLMTPTSSKDVSNITEVCFGESLNTRQRQELEAIIQKYAEVLTPAPGCFKGDLMMEIPLTSDVPVRKRMYDAPLTAKDAIRAEVEEMLELGIIEKSKSPYAAPVVLVQKKDGSCRFCIDYRALNKVTRFDAEPIPNMDTLFAEISKAKYFSKVDLAKGYWQIAIKPEDRPKTAFATHLGLYQFTRMPFGLLSAPAVFARMMRLLSLERFSALNFFDDILIHSREFQNHCEHVEGVLETLKEHGLTAKPAKVLVGFRTLEFLGHVIGQGSIKPEESKIKKILTVPTPQTVKQVRSLMGLFSFYRRYVPKFAEITAPLTDLTKKTTGSSKKVNWTEECQEALERVQTVLSKEPVLRLPQLDQPFVLRTDASSTGLGAVLLQRADDKLHPVSYASRKLLDRETRYSTIERECLAIVWGIQKFVRYLHGRKFHLETDHRPLTFLKSASFKNGRVMRWALALQEYAFDVGPIKGDHNTLADLLSRAEADQTLP